MTAPPTDTRPTDTVRDAFEAMIAFLTILIGGPMPRTWPDTATVAAKAIGSQARTTEEAERAVAAIAALRDLIQRAAEEHNRRAAVGGDFTPERIREARERCDKATPGPWVHSPLGVDEPHVSTKIGSDGERVDWLASPRSAPSKRWHDAAFIAHAREDLPAALAEIERLNRLVVATANADPSWVERCTTQAAEIERLATALQAERAAWQEASGADSPGHLTAALKARRARLTAELAARAPAARYDHGINCPCPACSEQTAAMRDAPADASLEARAALRDTFSKLVHIDHMARHLCENSGIDHTKDPPEATVDVADLTALGGALDAIDPTEEHDEGQRDRLMAVLDAVDASRPGLTEEQARAWERLRTAATTAVEAYEDSDADEAFEPLFAALDEALAGLATVEEGSASRGETGPAPTGLTRAMHDAQQRRSEPPDPRATLRDGDPAKIERLNAEIERLTAELAARAPADHLECPYCHAEIESTAGDAERVRCPECGQFSGVLVESGKRYLAGFDDAADRAPAPADASRLAAPEVAWTDDLRTCRVCGNPANRHAESDGFEIHEDGAQICDGFEPLVPAATPRPEAAERIEGRRLDASRPGLTEEQAADLRERAAFIAETCSGGDHTISNRDLIARRIRELPLRASRGETGPAPTGLTSAMHAAQQRRSVPPDPLALDPEDGTLCADCKTPRNAIHGALCSVRAGAKPGRVPDPRATLHAGDPASKLPKRGPSGVRVTGELDTPWGRLPILDLGEDKEPSR